jgi:hypothetical protein
MVSAVSGSTAALQGQIQRDQASLTDWLSCVSATTPKGKAEIQKYSGDISAAKQRLARIEASQPQERSIAPGSTVNPTTATQAASGSTESNRIDVWA